MKRSFLTRFLLAFCMACGFGSQSSAQEPAPSDVGDIFNDKGELGLESVRNDALAQSTATPHYKSNGVETRVYEGYFRAATNNSKLALLSDDGTSVWIDGQSVLSGAGQNQGFENFDSAFSPLSSSFEAGKIYRLRVEYTNTIHRGDADVDGVSLWAYDGGGEIVTVNATMQVKSKSPSSSWGQSADVAAGGVSSAEHQADIEIILKDSSDNPIPGLSVATPTITDGGQGVQDGSIAAQISLNGSTTDSQGKVTGTFTSGNRTETTTLELDMGEGSNATVAITQKWNELSPNEAWGAFADWDYSISG